MLGVGRGRSRFAHLLVVVAVEGTVRTGLMDSSLVFTANPTTNCPDVAMCCPADSGQACSLRNEQCGAPPSQGPAFHMMDTSCSISDPNGPFYDPLHKLYHIFYQLHIAMPNSATRSATGPVWGHAVSADLIKWAGLPVAIWNDQAYDSVAVYTGSATMVDGNPVIVYPGINNGTGTVNIATPANRSDPLLRDWVKSDQNPLLRNGMDDFSSGWLTHTGEYRFISNSQDAPGAVSQSLLPLYGSVDGFKSVYFIGTFDNVVAAECPSLFPLPRVANASAVVKSGAPTHVLLQAGYVQLGNLTDGLPGQMSVWKPLDAAARPRSRDAFVSLDQGASYASKDFLDPTRGRRLMWAWATVGYGALTLPRELTYDSELQQLRVLPADELTSLRTRMLRSVPTATLNNQELWIEGWEADIGRQIEVVVRFERPQSHASFGVDVLAGDGATATRVYVDGEPSAGVGSSFRARVGVTTAGTNLTSEMLGANLSTLQENQGVSVLQGVEAAKGCRTACAANAASLGGQCRAWTHDAETATCFLKGIAGWQYRADSTTTRLTSGILSNAPGQGGPADILQMSSGVDPVELRIFVDHSIVEAYWARGLVAMTASAQGTETVSKTGTRLGFFAFGGENVVRMLDATVYELDGIWTDPQTVLHSRR